VRQAWNRASAPGANDSESFFHSNGLNCSGIAVVRNIGPYMPLWPMKCSSRNARPSCRTRSIDSTKSRLLSTRSTRTSLPGKAARFSRAIVSAARSNLGPPVR
jgi:hypothetical protein